jgi:hypothetical protein
MTDRRQDLERERRAEAEKVLAGVRRDTETIGDTQLKHSTHRLADHFAGADADPDDRIEIWGRRIGRALSLVAVIALLAHLVSTYLIR